MSVRRHPIAWPGSGRLTLVLLALVPAAMAYPWQSTRDWWLLGVAVAAVIVLLGWWRGLHATTILRRRLAMMRRNGGKRSVAESGADTRTTVLLRVSPPATDSDVLPLPLIAGYLNRYGIRADAVRVTSRDTVSDAGSPQRETWVGLTLSGVDNLAALQARSPRIPLQKTAEVAVRRLADHLREIGWQASTAGPDDVPVLVAETARETWRAIWDGSEGYLAAYQVTADVAVPDTLAAIRSYPAWETWTAVEIAGTGTRRTLAVACALRTDAQPLVAAPIPGLIPQHGNHRPALRALDPLSVRRLDGHTDLPADLLTVLRWPTTAAAAGPDVRSPSRPRHAAVSRT